MSAASKPPSAEIDAAILHARARVLARPTAVENTGGHVELLQFRLADQDYAVDSRLVGEVCPLKQLTPLPCTPAFVRGVVNLRGRIVPVIDIKRFLDLPERGISDLHHIIVVAGHGIEIGLLADTIVGVTRVPASQLQTPATALAGEHDDYLSAVTRELLLLDVDRILSDPKLVVDESVAP